MSSFSTGVPPVKVSVQSFCSQNTHSPWAQKTGRGHATWFSPQVDRPAVVLFCFVFVAVWYMSSFKQKLGHCSEQNGNTLQSSQWCLLVLSSGAEARIALGCGNQRLGSDPAPPLTGQENLGEPQCPAL